MAGTEPREDRFLTTREVSDLLRVHMRTVLRWAKRGQLASCLLPSGHARRYREADVRAILNGGAK